MGGEDTQDDRTSACGVKLNLIRDGVYTWAVWAGPDTTIEELRRAKDLAVEVARELESELPHARTKPPRAR